MQCPIDHFSITIYDRWGKQVFFSNDIEQFWNANYCPDGVYVWIVRGKMIENGEVIAVEKMAPVNVIH